MPNALVDPDKIMMDCDNIINHLKSCPDLLSEKIEAHYYRGRARYTKGANNKDEFSISNALDDFQKVAHNDNADRHTCAEASYFCALCWAELGQPKHSECYFKKAEEGGFTNKSSPHDLGTITPKVENLKKTGHGKAWHYWGF